VHSVPGAKRSLPSLGTKNGVESFRAQGLLEYNEKVMGHLARVEDEHGE